MPGTLVGSERISFEGGRRLGTITLNCRTGRPHLDTISIIDGKGRLLKRINLLDAVRNSPFVHLLQSTLGDDAGGTWGLSPGDLVVSLRNLSAFAILEGESGRVKRLVRGSFLHQHKSTSHRIADGR